jgi:hypothetical protein
MMRHRRCSKSETESGSLTEPCFVKRSVNQALSVSDLISVSDFEQLAQFTLEDRLLT